MSRLEDVFCRLNLTVNFWIIWILFTLEAFYIRPEKKCYQKQKEAAKEVAEIMYPEFCKKISKQEFRKVCFVICTTVLQLIYYSNRVIRTVIYRKNAGQVVCSNLSVQIYIQTWLRITIFYSCTKFLLSILQGGWYIPDADPALQHFSLPGSGTSQFGTQIRNGTNTNSGLLGRWMRTGT